MVRDLKCILLPNSNGLRYLRETITNKNNQGQIREQNGWLREDTTKKSQHKEVKVKTRLRSGVLCY